MVLLEVQVARSMSKRMIFILPKNLFWMFPVVLMEEAVVESSWNLPIPLRMMHGRILN